MDKQSTAFLRLLGLALWSASLHAWGSDWDDRWNDPGQLGEGKSDSVAGVIHRVEIVSAASRKGLDIRGGSTEDRAPVIQYHKSNQASEWWELRKQNANDYYLIVNVKSGKCLDVPGSNNSDGAPVMQFKCHGGPNQRWKLDYRSDDGTYVIRARHSGKVLDVPGSSGADGIAIQQWTYHGGPNQQWKLFPRK